MVLLQQEHLCSWVQTAKMQVPKLQVAEVHFIATVHPAPLAAAALAFLLPLPHAINLQDILLRYRRTPQCAVLWRGPAGQECR